MKRTGDAIGYAAAHKRVIKDRGLASKLQCALCSSRADNWSYKHNSHKERVQLVGYGAGFRYSPDPSDYQPLCKACHNTHDVKLKERDTCRKGHARKPENLYVYDYGTYCKPCTLERKVWKG